MHGYACSVTLLTNAKPRFPCLHEHKCSVQLMSYLSSHSLYTCAIRSHFAWSQAGSQVIVYSRATRAALPRYSGSPAQGASYVTLGLMLSSWPQQAELGLQPSYAVVSASVLHGGDEVVGAKKLYCGAERWRIQPGCNHLHMQHSGLTMTPVDLQHIMH